MNKVTYIIEYSNGGWKYFNEEFEDRKEFNRFIKGLRNNSKCVAWKATNDRGYTYTSS